MPPPSSISKVSGRSNYDHERETENGRSEASNHGDKNIDGEVKSKLRSEAVGIVKSLLGPTLEDAVLRTLEFGKSLIQKPEGPDLVSKEKKEIRAGKKEANEPKLRFGLTEQHLHVVLEERTFDRKGNKIFGDFKKRNSFGAKLDRKTRSCSRRVSNVSKIRSLDSDLKKDSLSPEKIKRQLQALIQINKDEPPENIDNIFSKTPKFPMEITVMPTLCNYNEADLNHCSSSRGRKALRDENGGGGGSGGGTGGGGGGGGGYPESGATTSKGRQTVKKRPNKLPHAPEFLSNALGPTIDVAIIDNLKMMRDILKYDSGRGEGAREPAITQRGEHEVVHPLVKPHEVRLQNSEGEMAGRIEELQKKIQELESKEHFLAKQIEEEEREMEEKRKAFKEEEERKLLPVQSSLRTDVRYDHPESPQINRPEPDQCNCPENPPHERPEITRQQCLEAPQCDHSEPLQYYCSEPSQYDNNDPSPKNQSKKLVISKSQYDNSLRESSSGMRQYQNNVRQCESTLRHYEGTVRQCESNIRHCESRVREWEAKYEALRTRVACEEQKLASLKSQYECYKRELAGIKQQKDQKDLLKQQQQQQRSKCLMDAWDVFASRACHTKLPSFSRIAELERKQFKPLETGKIHCCFPSLMAAAMPDKSPKRSGCRSSGEFGSQSDLSRCGSKDVCESASKVKLKIKSGEIQFPIQRDVQCGLHQLLKTCCCSTRPLPKSPASLAASEEDVRKKFGSQKVSSFTNAVVDLPQQRLFKKCSERKLASRSKSDTAVRRDKCSRIIKVLWAITRINIFQNNCRTYEIMDATPYPPACAPVKTEGIFVVKCPQKKPSRSPSRRKYNTGH